jgi:hypothetical protein
VDIKDIIKEIKQAGFYEIDGLKLIYSNSIYTEEYKKIEKSSIPVEHKKSFPFAVFRGNLYNFNLNSSLNDDYELYCRYIYNKRLVNLQLNTLFLSKEIELQYSSNHVREQFEKELTKINKVLIINSFHYSSYKSILPCFLINNCDVFLLATPKVILENEHKTNLFSTICNNLFSTDSSACFINAEDYLSLIKLYEILSKKEFRRKPVLLIFPDGNIGADRKNDTNKNLFKVNFHGTKIHIRQGIFSFAKTLLAPVFNVLTESHKDFISMKIHNYYDFTNKNIHPDEFTSMLFQNFEKFLCRKNIPKWECMMYLHSWMDTKAFNKDIFVTEKTFDKERYTSFKIDNQQYIFDSKYLLSLEVDSDNIKKCVLKNKFYE